MKDFRRQIDQIDEKIVEFLGKRMRLVKEIAKFKQAENLPIKDTYREEELRRNVKAFAEKNKLDPEFVNHLYSHVFIESRRIQGEDI